MDRERGTAKREGKWCSWRGKENVLLDLLALEMKNTDLAAVTKEMGCRVGNATNGRRIKSYLKEKKDFGLR